MAKVVGPLMSVDASGKFGNAMVFSKWRGLNTVRQFVIPAYSRSNEQGNVRDLLKDASQAWSTGATIGLVTVDAAYKLAYNTLAEGRTQTGFNLFMRDCMAKNGAEAYDGSLELPTEPGDQTPN
jgi:hypothetical protein